MEKSNIIELVEQVDVENIYTHVLALEGPRYPLFNLEELNAAADYIYNELEKLGFTAEYQEFNVDESDITFKNVLGYCGDRNSPAIVLGSHIDTIPDCPGANDNLSAVGILLEFARVISQLENPPSIIFGFFTLEEEHPGLAAKVHQLKQQYRIEDAQRRFTSWEYVKLHREFFKMLSHAAKNDKDLEEAVDQFISDYDGSLSSDLQRYLRERVSAITLFSKTLSLENLGLLGSGYFVEQLKKSNQSVKYMINFDTLGWIYNTPKTQKPLPVPVDFLTTHKTDLESEMGNFVAIITDSNSVDLFNKFLENCQNEKVDVPYVGINLPMQYEDIKKQAPDTLRMDHAPFWKNQIPAITMCDSSEFRTGIYHTPADISKFMDFDVLAKLVKATLITVLES